MITMSELLQDASYKQFLLTKPQLPRVARDKDKQSSPPWVVYVQLEQNGKWGSKSFWKYSEAVKFLNIALKRKVYDAAINNKRFPTDPPGRLVRVKGKFVINSRGQKQQVTKYIGWKPRLTAEDEQHNWCLYCRRPTVFKYFNKHRRHKGGLLDTTVPRCCICGASARIALHHTDRSIRVH